jgi:hypothetical protein
MLEPSSDDGHLKRSENRSSVADMVATAIQDLDLSDPGISPEGIRDLEVAREQ